MTLTHRRHVAGLESLPRLPTGRIAGACLHTPDPIPSDLPSHVIQHFVTAFLNRAAGGHDPEMAKVMNASAAVFALFVFVATRLVSLPPLSRPLCALLMRREGSVAPFHSTRIAASLLFCFARPIHTYN
jgi:hypothetical protein